MDRVSRTVDNLLNIISEHEKSLQCLVNLVIKLMGEESDLKRCDVMRTKSELIDHLGQYDVDYVVFITLNRPVWSMDREDIDLFSESGQLLFQINQYWGPGTIAITVP